MALVPPALSSEEPEDRFSGQASLLVVELPVRVLSGGRSVVGLKADDFELYDRGERRELVGFEVLDTHPNREIPGPEGGIPMATAAVRRNWVFLFDFAYADGLSLSKALEATEGFITTDWQSGDHVALGFFSALRGLKLVDEPSQDPQRIASSVELVAALLAHDLPTVLGLASRRDRSFNPAVGSIEELLAEAGIMIRADPYWPHRSTIRSFARSLAELADRYSILPGQRSIVLYSHGFDPKFLIGRGSAGTLAELEQTFRACRGSGWVIQAINAGGLRALSGRESLFFLAYETGGESFEHFNDLGEALRLMAQHGSMTYALSFQVNQPEADGSFHRLRVRLRPGLPKARLIHRPGYYAPRPDARLQLDTPRERR